ncbi:type VI secretion system baseplate subunit TssG [Saccharicrinis sp. GN24d3]|uniref:type VI secretion system baseplate subunit TssG n=1 Tax=Saccharicrinis sp. GN24d3 TaxID=3458416 RepID=UPI0040373703
MKLKKKATYLNNLLDDLRAEFVGSWLLQEDIPLKNILASRKGISKRKWSSDIHNVTVTEFKNNQEALNISINRPGIYDVLPEEMFHDLHGAQLESGKEMARDSMKQKNIEKEARSFFGPLENELFLFSVLLADKESQLHSKISSDFVNGLSTDFWNTGEQIPLKYIEKFNKLLTFASQITGNPELSAHCLEYILEEKIKISYHPKPHVEELKLEDSFKMGESTLGEDSVLTSSLKNDMGTLSISIGPLKNTSPADYIVGGEARDLLDGFNEYFVPVELDQELKILLDEKDNSFVITDESETENIYLGYNTVI